MELKKYVLLSNNKILNESAHHDLWQTETGEWYWRMGVKVIATSDEVLDLVRDRDYIMLDNKVLYLVIQDCDMYENPTDLMVHPLIAGKYPSNKLTDVKEGIIRIYKWQGKDLVCVWERVG